MGANSNNKTEAISMSSLNTEAEALKEQANKLFGEKKYQLAIDRYTAAIQLDENNVFYYSNRAAAFTELRRYVYGSILYVMMD